MVNDKGSKNNAEWYLPIFAVQNPNKTRLDWDAAAKYNDRSLNDFLLKGPDLNETLWNTLYRFREYNVAFCADVSEMFHRIQVAQEDRRFQRFLWREDPNDEIIAYQMEVQTFGAVCSPTIAQFVKNENARLYELQYPEASLAIVRAFYVDDWVQSCLSERYAEELIKQVQLIMGEANFPLLKWITNRPEMLQRLGIPIQNQRDDKQLQKMPKALGITWDNTKDDFRFNMEHISTTTETPTKRKMLSLVMTIFDPLGWLAFLTIVGRLILRETWKFECEWDEYIPQEIREKWHEWTRLMDKMKKIRIDRWCGLRLVNRELHIFVDASERAMCAVAHWKGTGEERHITYLAASKSKLSYESTINPSSRTSSSGFMCETSRHDQIGIERASDTHNLLDGC